ncbi:MAG TPA: hypothetical protein VMM56_06505 [Planctomycetaceae bacterium]|nr:hypothetical protein [Planctomycetaceae bacterium]
MSFFPRRQACQQNGRNAPAQQDRLGMRESSRPPQHINAQFGIDVFRYLTEN